MWIIDTGKSVIAFAVDLFRPSPQDHFTVKHDLHAAALAGGSIEKASGQVAFGIGVD